MSTMSPKPEMPTIIIMDERERGEIRTHMQSLPIDLKIRTLEMGDYVISPHTVIERKRGDDFVASIYDQRLFLQLEKLKVAYSRPLLILENPKRMFERKFINPKAVYGALVYVSTRIGIPIIPTADVAQTVAVIFNLARIEQRTGENFSECDWIRELPVEKGISRGDQEYFVQGLVDVGLKRARQMLDMFQTPQHILHALELTEVIRTKSGNPKGISGVMTAVSNIGPKIIDRNQNLLHYSYKKAKKEKKRAKAPKHSELDEK